MTRNEASKTLRTELDKHGLQDWKLRINSDPNTWYFGLCEHSIKTISLNAHHIDQHPAPEILNTIRHEVAHALVGVGHAHNDVWRNKATEIGCDNTSACASYNLSPEVLDAIRSGSLVEVDFTERDVLRTHTTVEKVREPKFKITKLQDLCPYCHKVAKEVSNKEVLDKIFIKLECGHLVIKVRPKATPFESIVSNDFEDYVINCKHEWDKNQCIHCHEYKLFPFQVIGARFLESNFGKAGIFDEMGLGKTVQAAAYLKFHPEAFPVLFIVKSAIKYQWYKEIVRWLGPNYIPQVFKTGRDGALKGLKTYVVSYDLLRRLDTNKIASLGIKTVILDEVQAIKNPDSSRTQNVRSLVRGVEHIIPLSGTPWKNRGPEFFVVLNMLDPVKFHSYQSFLNNWVNYYTDMNTGKEKIGGIRNIPKFKEYTKNLFIRRERVEVMPELPLINRMKLVTEIDEQYRDSYNAEKKNLVDIYNESVISGTEGSFESVKKLNQSIILMRQIVGNAKIDATVNFVQEFIEETDRSLVVGVHHIGVGEQMTKRIQNFTNGMNGSAPQVLTLTSKMNAEDRFDTVQKFNEKRTILIASTLSAGEGTDGLQKTCSDIVLHERQWNPMNEDQLLDRLARIGQSASGVNATYVHAEDSVDIVLDRIVETKRAQFHQVMNKGEMAVWSESSIMSEVIKAIATGR